MRRISAISLRYNSPPENSSFDFTSQKNIELPNTFTFHKDIEIVINDQLALIFDSKQSKTLIANKFYTLPDITSEKYSDLDIEVLASMLNDSMLYQFNDKVKLLSKTMVDGVEKKMLKYYPGISLAFAKNDEKSFLMSYSISFPDDRFKNTKPPLINIYELLETPWPLSQSMEAFPFKNKT